VPSVIVTVAGLSEITLVSWMTVILERAEIPEYWIIDPNSERVEAYRLSAGGYDRIEESGGAIASSVLAGFYLRTAWLWRETRPKVRDVRRELGILDR